MAAIQVLEAHDWGTLHSSTLYTPTILAEINGSTFIDGAKYLILYRCAFTGSSTSDRWNSLYYSDPSGPSSISLAVKEPNDSTLGDVISWARVVTAHESASYPAKISINRVSSSGTTYGADASIVAINLDDLGTDGIDYWTDTDLTDSTHTTSFSDTNRASVTLTPDAEDDLLVIGCAGFSVNNTLTQYEARIWKDGSTLANSIYHSMEGENVAEIYSTMLFGVDVGVTATERTYSIATRDDAAGTYTVTRDSTIVVIPLSLFETVSINQAASVTSPTANAWAELATLAHAPATTGTQVILASASIGIASRFKLQLQFDGVSDPGDAYYSQGLYDSTDRASWPLFVARSIDTDGETIDLDYYTTSTSTDFFQPMIVAFSAELTPPPPQLKNTQTTKQYDTTRTTRKPRTAVTAEEYDDTVTTKKPRTKVTSTVEGS